MQRVRPDFHKKGFGLEKMVKNMLAAQNTFVMRMENAIASFTNNTFLGAVVPCHPISTEILAGIATNTVIAKVSCGSGIRMSGSGTAQT